MLQGGGRFLRASIQGAGEERRNPKNRRALTIALPGLDPRPIFSAFLRPTEGPRPPVARRPGRSRLRPCGATLRRSHDLPCRRTLLLRALGQCPRGDGLMHENAAASLNPPLWGDPRAIQPGQPNPKARGLPRQALMPLLSSSIRNHSAPAPPVSATFSLRGVTTFSYLFSPEKSLF